MGNGSRFRNHGDSPGVFRGLCRALLLVPALALTCPAADAAPRKGSSSAGEPRLYRWVDDEGVVHFGDQVPPEYADHEWSQG